MPPAPAVNTIVKTRVTTQLGDRDVSILLSDQARASRSGSQQSANI